MRIRKVHFLYLFVMALLVFLIVLFGSDDVTSGCSDDLFGCLHRASALSFWDKVWAGIVCIWNNACCVFGNAGNLL